MVQFLIGLLGISIIAAIGYITVNACLTTDRYRLYEKILLSPICFFVCIAIIYIINLITAGSALRNSLIFFTIFFSYVILTFIFGYSRIKKDLKCFKKSIHQKRSSNFKVKIILFLLLLIIFVIIALTPISSGINLNSDAGRHIMRTHQLLNGFPYSHTIPYHNVPSNHYPNLTHTALAFFMKLLNIHVFDSYYILHLFQAVLLPIGMFMLMYHITQKYWIALIAMILSAVYGGHFVDLTYHSWWLNTAIERLNPSHITRMLSLVFLLVFLFLFHKIQTIDSDRRSHFLAGIILGFAGLVHTYAFSFLFLFLIINLVLNVKNREKIKSGLIVLCTGTLVASVGYLPLFWEKLCVQPTNILDQLGYCQIDPKSTPQGQILIYPFRFLIHYGIVGIMALLSLTFLKRSKDRNLMILLLCAVLSIFILTYVKEILINVLGMRLPYHPSQHKYGKSIFLVFVILSGLFLNDLFKISKLTLRPIAWTNIGIIIILTVSIFGGAITTISAAVKLSPKKVTSKANKNLRNQKNIAALLKSKANLNSVIAVPEKIGKHFAMMSGLDILYMDHPKTYSHCRKFASQILFASEPQLEQFGQINGLDFADTFKKILSVYQIGFLIIPNAHKDRYDHLEFLDPVDEGTWEDNQRYLIYKVHQSMDKRKNLSGNDLTLEAIFQYDKNFSAILGYYPLQKKRVLIPKIFNFRDFTVTGLTWAKGDLWIAILEKQELYNIHPESGKVIRVLKNPAEKPSGITWDGKAFWIAEAPKNRILKMDPETGNIMDSISFPNFKPTGLAWGQNHLWTADSKNQKIYKLSPTNGNTVLTYKTPKNPFGVAWRDGSLWASTGWKGEIYKIALRNDQENIAFFNNSYRITEIAWRKNRLWGVDRRASTLIEFRDIRPSD